jgi:hypothetical protein
VCEVCGEPLSPEDVAAGETICLECAVVVELEVEEPPQE